MDNSQNGYSRVEKTEKIKNKSIFEEVFVKKSSQKFYKIDVFLLLDFEKKIGN